MFNKEIKTMADKVAQEIALQLPFASISQIGYSTIAGYSVYITVYYRKANEFVSAKLRISDHSVGCFRMQTDGCAYASDEAGCQKFIDKVVPAVTALDSRIETVAWISASNRNHGKRIDINDYTDLQECETLYTGKRKSDGYVVKIKKITILN